MDNGQAIKKRLAQPLTVNWQTQPYFWNRYGNFNFTIQHPRPAAPAPEIDPELGALDSAMFAQLTTSFPVINQAIDDNLVRARNQPPPAPPDPNSRKFWRLHCDLSIDSDRDGSPDWAEFETAARHGANQGGLQGDAFDPDTDHNGVLDGHQLDLDQDGTPDAMDVNVGDATAASEIGPLPRYAFFSIGVPYRAEEPEYRPIEINDQGTVLCPYDIWSGGVWTTLAKDAEGIINGRAMGINDLGEIVGTCDRLQPSASSAFLPGNVAYWSDLTAMPSLVSQSEEYAWSPLFFALPAYYAGSRISNDGRILAYSQRVSSAGTSEGLDQNYLWTLPGHGRTTGKVAVTNGYDQLLDQNNYWGAITSGNGVENTLSTNGHSVTIDSIAHLSLLPNNGLLLGSPQSEPPEDSNVILNGIVTPSTTFARAVDVAADGTAIGRNGAGEGLVAPICLNGKWLDIKRTAPSLEASWITPTLTLKDTTPGGWILGYKTDLTNQANDYAVMLPIRAEGYYTNSSGVSKSQAAGVDDFSIGSYAPGNAVQDRIWIMAPQGSFSKIAKLKAPLAAQSPLTIKATGIKFGGQQTVTLTNKISPLVIQADSGQASGQEVLLDLKMASNTSLAQPIGFKIMKNRVVKVRLYKVTKINPPVNRANPETGIIQSVAVPDDTADLLPDVADLTNYLNDLYKPQINVTFDVSYEPTPIRVNWDLDPDNSNNPNAGNGVFDAGTPGSSGPEQSAIRAARPTPLPGANIDIYLMGTSSPIKGGAWGCTLRLENGSGLNACWIVADALLTSRTVGKVMIDIGHEIGHIFAGYGHPNDRGTLRGPAELPGTAHKLRLMCNGAEDGPQSRMFVKGEWDAAEDWLKEEERNGRIGP